MWFSDTVAKELYQMDGVDALGVTPNNSSIKDEQTKTP